MTERVQVTIEGGVADVRLNRPEKLNALDRPMFEALVATGQRLSADRSEAEAAHEDANTALGELPASIDTENKLAAVPVLKDRILDRENAFWLYQHFTYRDDKAKVQEILEH